MNTFIVTITETLVRTVPVSNTYSADEALESVMRQYNNSEIVLDSGDFTGVKYSAEKQEDESLC